MKFTRQTHNHRRLTTEIVRLTSDQKPVDRSVGGVSKDHDVFVLEEVGVMDLSQMKSGNSPREIEVPRRQGPLPS